MKPRWLLGIEPYSFTAPNINDDLIHDGTQRIERSTSTACWSVKTGPSCT